MYSCDALTASRVLWGDHFPDLTVPLVLDIQFSITPADVSQWWANSASHFSLEDLEKERGKFVFGLDHIPPVPTAAAEALLSAYAPNRSDHAALLRCEGHACLVRPYLGRRRTRRGTREGEETLWNHPLYLDQSLAILGLEGAKHIAREMALGLAVLHWAALVDSMDVEFVFGGTSAPSATFAPSAGKRATQLWLLDFDKAQKLQLPRSDAGEVSFGKTQMCSQMVTAVTANDPYFPTPHAPHRPMDYGCDGDNEYVELLI
ncbi:hypothetical protein E8E12_009095 [Didymella heteroderae]|uniref:DUF3669 domain-containing protein n=1 Tax=Didymella heteroderae TaxID=1769908 RepID=A0A9P4WUT0_9PLEO|nr:hypothetical protein E8E12_009095 [Didymella heteroderae]